MPLLSIWFTPRKTIRHIIDSDPNWGVVLLAIISGLTISVRTSVLHGMHPIPDLVGLHPFLDDIIHYGVGPSAGWMMTISSIFVYGSTLGVLLILLLSGVLYLAARISRIKISFEKTRAIVAWSFAPIAPLLLLWGLTSQLGFELLRTNSFSFGYVVPWNLPIVLEILYYIDFSVKIYILFIHLICVSEIMNINIKKAVSLVAFSYLPPLIILIIAEAF